MGKKVVRQSLSDQAYLLIIEKIRSGELKPGDRINIEEFSREIDVSRTPMREAVNRLIQNGLLETRHNVGPSVAEFSKKDITDLIETNTILLEGVMKVIFSGTVALGMADKMMRIVEEQRQALDEGDNHKYYLKSMEFHYALIDECPNDKLKSFATDTQTQIGIWVYQYQENPKIRQQGLSEHQLLTELLRDGKKEEFIQLLKEHNERPLEYFRQT